ncbi:MAG: hypothetical protein KAG37_09150, partial [Flavobacteriales bacterium]|nr:hypothetical protein [Flavobacteriales bacterium]
EANIYAEVETSKVEVVVERETERFIDGSIRYKLEDFEELEHKIEEAKPEVSAQVEEIIEEEEDFEPEMQIHIVKEAKPEVAKVVEKPTFNEPLTTEVAVDPTDIPLTKKDKIGKERRERLKRFNHNFKTRTINPSSVDDLERQPAYLRAGIDVTSTEERNSASRYSIGSNGEEDVVLRRNNSFLHDNVD